MPATTYDFAIIGGGIVGLATAYALTQSSSASLAVLEAEPALALHQTGHNSGVIHSGLYYRPGSLKARLCVEGRRLLYRFCHDHAIAHEQCGKVIVATEPEEIARLDQLEARAAANGLEGVRRLTPDQLRHYEPHAVGLAALLVPETGIVDFVAVARRLAELVRERGGQVHTVCRLLACRADTGRLVLDTTWGTIRCRGLINCAGLYADRVARLCGVEPGVQIIPFRGEYYELVPEQRHLVRNLIYPVPDPRFPFLGVHFTRLIHGGVEAGPNAVLALHRQGYRRTRFSFRDTFELLRYRGFWRMTARYWRPGLTELRRSLSRRSFARALQRLIPEIEPADLIPAPAGVRAQAVTPAGELLDDFAIAEADRMIHVVNAPSPAATASLSIGRTIADMALNKIPLA